MVAGDFARRRCLPLRSAALRSAAFSVVLFGWHCCGPTHLMAQERAFSERQQSADSPFRKLELLQQSVKRKLKSALGVNRAEPTTETAHQSPSENAAIRQGQRVEQTPSPMNDPRQGYSAQTYSGQGYSGQTYSSQGNYARDNATQGYATQDYWAHADANQDYFAPQSPTTTSVGNASVGNGPMPTGGSHLQQDMGRVVPATENEWSQPQYQQPQSPQQQYANDNPMRPVQYREQLPQSNSFSDVQRPLPPPIEDVTTTELPNLQTRQSSRPPVQRWDGASQGYRDQPPVSYSDGNSVAPLARGSVLGEPQITATQHALRLIEENGDLKAKLAMIDAENQRLKEKLAQSESLLSRSTEAVESAYEEIEAGRLLNRELEKKLADVEQQHNRHLLETDRMLQSIREELDSVLVREISASGN